jgi:hypothetical protein
MIARFDCAFQGAGMGDGCSCLFNVTTLVHKFICYQILRTDLCYIHLQQPSLSSQPYQAGEELEIEESSIHFLTSVITQV